MRQGRPGGVIRWCASECFLVLCRRVINETFSKIADRMRASLAAAAFMQVALSAADGWDAGLSARSSAFLAPLRSAPRVGRRCAGDAAPRSSLELRAAVASEHEDLAAGFSRWLAERGVQGIGSTVRVGRSSLGGWGLFAARSIQPGETALSLPLRSLALSEESVEDSAHREYLDLISEELWSMYGFSGETPHGDPLIATQLMLHAQQGAASEWAPYLAMLPRQPTAGWRWDSPVRSPSLPGLPFHVFLTLRVLCGTKVPDHTCMRTYSASTYMHACTHTSPKQGRDPILPECLREDAAAIRASILAEFARLEQRVFGKHRGVFSADAFTLEQYCWAKECVLSRAYAVEGLGGLVCLLPGIDMANHAVGVQYGVTSDVPHMRNRGVGVEGDVEAEEEMVGLVVDRAYKEGEEVWSSYGLLDKSRLCVSCPVLLSSAPLARAASCSIAPGRSRSRAGRLVRRPVCVFITAVPITKLFCDLCGC